MKTNLYTKQNESGRTMLEMLGVLAIMGIIMYGAVSGINYGMSTYKVNQVYNDVQDQMQGITDLYSWNREYPSDMTKTVCENDIFSQTCSEVEVGESKVKVFAGSHAFGGGVYVNGTASGDNFVLKYAAIPESACERLSEMEWGNISLITSQCSDSTDMEWTWK